MSTLVLLRHGESNWNAENRFTGWIDVALSNAGRTEAHAAGKLFVRVGVLPDVVFTSVLKRAISTADLAMDACDRHWIPTSRSWRLNERHYGALQGAPRDAVLAKYGRKRFDTWHRSYDGVPPPIDDAAARTQAMDCRYAEVPNGILPRTESLADVTARLMPYWENTIMPELDRQRVVCIVAHSNSLRALVRHLDGLDDAELSKLNIPTGMPLLYELDGDLLPRYHGGRYLRPG